MDTSFSSEVIFIITGITGLIIVALFYFIFKYQKNLKKLQINENVEVSVHRIARRAMGNRNRVREGAIMRQNFQDTENEEENHEVSGLSNIDINDSKLGAKKRAKLEAKAEKKAQREIETKIREQRKIQHEKEESERKLQEEKELLAKIKEEEEKRKLLEEKRRREEEEYQKMKADFTVEKEGFDEEGEGQQGNLLQEFIGYIKQHKVVMLEDLAARFRLKIQTTIRRIEDLLDSGSLTGVIDDRGKFIYITADELQAVASFVNRRGRVTIQELVENSNNLISLN